MNVRPRILIVEDNSIVAADIKARVERMGYEVTDCVTRGQSAIDSAMRETPNLILMDIKLKGEMSGIEAATSIRASRDIPIIYLTSYTDDATLERAKLTDPFGYIVKPFEDQELRTVIEISIHKHQAELRLKESEQWFKTTLTSIGDGVITTDMQACVTFMNPVAEELTGWPFQEAVGREITEIFNIINEDTLKTVVNPVTKVIETGKVIGLANHTLLIARDGRRMPIKDSGSPIVLNDIEHLGVVLVFQDNTESRLAEKRIHDSEDRFRKLFDNSPLPAQSLDKKGMIKSVNQTWLKTLGYNKDEVEGGFFGDYLNPSWKGHFAENFPRFKAIGEVLGIEFEMKKKDGSFITVKFDGKIRKDEAGNFLQTDCVFRDVSEQVRLEKKLKEQENAIRQHQKSEAIGTLAGGIAHDFNNILAAIVGFTELSLDDAEVESVLHDNLQEVYSASMRARDLVQQILVFSRKGNQDNHVLDICPIIEDTISMLRSTIPTTIDIQQRIGEKPIKIKANTSQLHQVLINLVTNGVHAIDKGTGTITIVVEEESINGSKVRDAIDMVPGKYAKISVSDTGAGIDKAHLHSIFDPYFSTKEPDKGSGLGLSVVHGIIKSYGGYITVSSEPGSATTFTIYLPISPENLAATPMQSDEPLPGGSEHILVVDDEPSIARFHKRRLERMGYEVTVKLSSSDALESFRFSPGDFDLVITDMTMPEMSGIDLSRAIKNIREDIPIILCTGFSEDINSEADLPDQLDALLMKPVESPQLFGKIRELLDIAN